MLFRSILYSLLLITRQAAQLICLGCTIINSAVHVMHARMLQLLITNNQ